MIVAAATWYLLVSGAYRGWTVPMENKEACVLALESLQKGSPHYCVNTKTGEVIIK